MTAAAPSASGRAVEQADRIGDHRRAGKRARLDLVAIHGVVVLAAVGVGVDAEVLEGAQLDAVLVHVAAHEQGGERGQRRAVNRLRSRRPG